MGAAPRRKDYFLFKSWKSRAAVFAVAASMAVPVLALASPAGASGATKQTLLDHSGGNCSTGATSGTPTTSFAIINTAGGNVSLEVSVKGLSPNTTYDVDLIQTPSGESCLQSPGETTLTTNGQGNGNAHLREPILPGTTGAFAMLIAPGFTDILATTGTSI